MRLILPLLSALVVSAAPLAAQSVQFAAFDVYGFRPGATLREVSTAVRQLDGGGLRCDRSKLDARVDECRATLSVTDVSGPVELWMSAIDSVNAAEGDGNVLHFHKRSGLIRHGSEFLLLGARAVDDVEAVWGPDGTCVLAAIRREA